MITTKSTCVSVLGVVLALVFTSSVIGQEAQNTTTSPAIADVKIKNFGQMDDRFFRGAQPKKDQFDELAALGIKTVIDLREDPEEYEKANVEALGMRYVNIPMIAKKYPQASQVEEFLKLVNDPTTGKFFVHCAGGRHRTGVMGAVYRFNHYKWNFEQVYAEMKKYDFYTRWGHGDMKKFVQDYAESFSNQNTAAAAASGVKQ